MMSRNTELSLNVFCNLEIHFVMKWSLIELEMRFYICMLTIKIIIYYIELKQLSGL